ncbi:malignant fibrous histiocytoma-amplified sequence 1 homolog [Ptychodera flava]|uniref:malignant fibrous histiocytoma-amplified sequence 1 homolog n=1 Tax=Ptychodera flava TaxID=63121 RepID=UPI00396A499E
MGSRPSKVSDDTILPYPVFEVKRKRLAAIPDELIDDCRTDIKTLNLSDNLIEYINDEISELSGLSYVDVSNNRLNLVIYSFFELPNLTHVNFSDNNLMGLPGVESAKKLLHLDISNNKFTKLDTGVFTLRRLRHLLVSDNRVDILPKDICGLHALRTLDLRGNTLNTVLATTLPSSLRTLKLAGKGIKTRVFATEFLQTSAECLRRLEHLDVSNRRLDHYVSNTNEGFLHIVTSITSLISLNVEGNCIKSLPDSFSNLSCLRTCVLNDNSIRSLPSAAFKGLRELQVLHVDKNKLTALEPIPLDDMQLVALSLNDNKIKRLPKEIAQPTLESLLLDNNDLTDINNIDFHKMQRLKSLSLKRNHLECIPTDICQAHSLVTLDIEGNQIQKLPSGFHFARLEKLNLGYNKLKKFPRCLSEMETLKDVNLDGNPLEECSAGSDSNDEKMLADTEEAGQRQLPEEASTIEELEHPLITETSAMMGTPVRTGRIFMLGAECEGKVTLIQTLRSIDEQLQSQNGMKTTKGSEEECVSKDQEKKAVSNEINFMDSISWEVTDDTCIDFVYCGGPGMAHIAYPLFYTENTLYAIVVDLEQYSTTDNFREFIEVWIDSVLSVVGEEVMFTIIGTHTGHVQNDKIEETCRSINDKTRNWMTDLKERRNMNSLMFTFTPEVIVTRNSEEEIIAFRDKMAGILLDKNNHLIPIESLETSNEAKAESQRAKLQQIEECLREIVTHQDGSHSREVALTLTQFRNVLQQVDVGIEHEDRTLLYLKRIGVVQHYKNMVNLKNSVFHNLHYLKEILVELFGRERENFIKGKFSRTANNTEDRLLDAKKKFKSKAIISEEVIRKYVVGDLNVSPAVLALVLDVLIECNLCNTVELEKDSPFVQGTDIAKSPSRILRFPNFLSKLQRLPRRFSPIFETRLELKSRYSSTLINSLACAYNGNIKAAWVDGFYGVFNGITMTISEQEGLSKSSTLTVKTAFDRRPSHTPESPDKESRTELIEYIEHIFNVLNEGLLRTVRATSKRLWPDVTYITKLKVLCPDELGCEHAHSPVHHQWIPFPKTSTMVVQELYNCQYQQGAVDHGALRTMITKACDMVYAKLDPSIWRDFGLQLGMQDKKVQAIEEQDYGNDKDKLKELLHAWKDKLHTPGVMTEQFQLLINTLRVIGEESLAEQLLDLKS